jgi:hypothetical protein
MRNAVKAPRRENAMIKVNSENPNALHATGYSVTYASGWTLSVQWGHEGLYCDKNTVEVMAWRKGKDMTETQLWEDGVVGWVTIERLAKLQYLLAKGTPDSISQARMMKW